MRQIDSSFRIWVLNNRIKAQPIQLKCVRPMGGLRCDASGQNAELKSSDRPPYTLWAARWQRLPRYSHNQPTSAHCVGYQLARVQSNVILAHSEKVRIIQYSQNWIISTPPEVIGWRLFGGLRTCFCFVGFAIWHLFQTQFPVSRYRNIKCLASRYHNCF